MKKLLFVPLLVVLLGGLVFGGCAAPEPAPVPAPAPAPAPALPPAPDKIVFGQAVALSGPLTILTGVLEQPAMNLWLQEVNANGGIYVKEYDKRIPVELIRYDDRGDPDTTLKLVKKLILEDKVDFLVPPHGEPAHFAMLAEANKHGYPIVTMTMVPRESYKETAKDWPYVFHTTPYASIKQAFYRDLFVELGIKSVAIIYAQHSMAIEEVEVITPLLEAAGIEIVLSKSYPENPTDLSPLLKQIKALNPDAVHARCFPPDSFLITEQSKIIGLNPKLFTFALGPAMPMYRDKFGTDVIEGLVADGGWNPNYSAQAKDYYEKFQQLNEFEPDFWSSSLGYAQLQIYNLAIEKAGTLDRAKVRDVMATATFDTVQGPIKFVNQVNETLASFIGQWQNGVFEAIVPQFSRTAEPVYPKPNWP